MYVPSPQISRVAFINEDAAESSTSPRSCLGLAIPSSRALQSWRLSSSSARTLPQFLWRARRSCSLEGMSFMFTICSRSALHGLLRLVMERRKASSINSGTFGPLPNPYPAPFDELYAPFHLLCSHITDSPLSSPSLPSSFCTSRIFFFLSKEFLMATNLAQLICCMVPNLQLPHRLHLRPALSVFSPDELRRGSGEPCRGGHTPWYTCAPV